MSQTPPASKDRRPPVKMVPCGIDGCPKMFYKANTLRKKHIRKAHPYEPKLRRGKAQSKSILLFKHHYRKPVNNR